MEIQTGDTAPDFTLVTMGANGPELFTLSEALKESKVVILFIPMAFTGVCTEQFCNLSEDLSPYETLGAKVVGISGDSPFSLSVWAEKEGISFPLLSDYDHKVTADFGIAYEQFLPEKNLIMGGVPKRSAFVIDQDSKVLYAEVNEIPSNLPNMEKIKETLA